MKLPHTYAPLDLVLEKMGVRELVRIEVNSSDWRPLEVRLQEEGVDVSPGDIVVAKDGTFEYQNRKVIVYIRDQNLYGGQLMEYKFHIANCRTLRSMKKAKRYSDRYVVSTRQDGLFIVNIIGSYGRQVVEANKLMELKVCKNCLAELNYNGYRWSSQKVYSEFSIGEFFEKYISTSISGEPRHTDVSAPLNVYSENQSIFSRICRERARWRCESKDCGIDLSEPEGQKFLHAHHVNGNKSDNSWENLKALCVECHFKQPGHSLKKSDYQEFLKYKLSKNRYIKH